MVGIMYLSNNNIMDWLIFVINAFWLILPCYSANFFPVLVKGKCPMDFKKKFHDGKRILGDGKTWEGFFAGIIFGFSVGILQIALYPYLPIPLFNHSFFTVLVLSLGALIGDCIGSFVKRRFGLKRGEFAPLLDQTDFLVLSLIILKFFAELDFPLVFFLILVTPFLHFLSNFFGFIFKLKKEPW